MSEPLIGAEAAARLERLFAKANVKQSDRTRALVAAVGEAGRAEARAAAARLDSIGELVAVRMAELGECEDWAVDTTDVVASEVAAELRVSHSKALGQLRYARAMRERLPRVAAVFRAGDIDLATFARVVFRTDLVDDELVMSFVDAELSAEVGGWTALTRGRLDAAVDTVVTRLDRDAVRRRRDAAEGRGVWIADRTDGLADVSGMVFGTAAHALDQRLSALAATVCDEDGRSIDQRRADAVLAMSAGADRMACQCGRAECPAADKPPASPVLIHVIADAAATEGRGDNPGRELGTGALIPPELVSELAKSAGRRPLIFPGDAPPEPGYVPSRALADFVRARDLTCRAPGCDKPAEDCDLDHTIPYGRGGVTHASNLKCLCRLHHLLKTFWGWHDEQLRDGTVIWTSPAGVKYVTTAGSARLFPTLCLPTGPLPSIPQPATATPGPSSERSTNMPRRRQTRTRERARLIAAERQANQQDRCDRPTFGKRQRRVTRELSPPPF